MACLHYLTILYLANFVFFNGCHADRALIDIVCKESQDYNFCSSTFEKGPRSATADLHGLYLIAISNTIIQIQDTMGRIPGIISQVKDPLGKKLLEICKSDYNNSLGKFQGAFDSTSKNAYWDSINYIRDGTNAIIDCHNIYQRNGSIATSPIAGDNINAVKLSEIILKIINRLV